MNNVSFSGLKFADKLTRNIVAKDLKGCYYDRENRVRNVASTLAEMNETAGDVDFFIKCHTVKRPTGPYNQTENINYYSLVDAFNNEVYSFENYEGSGTFESFLSGARTKIFDWSADQNIDKLLDQYM